MPIQNPLHRTYCKTCQDFKIHTADYVCQTCDTKFTSYFPSEVDQNLVEQQRKRYSKQVADDFLGLYGSFIQGNGLHTIMNDFKQVKVIECDAGQKEIDNKRKEQKLEAKRIGQEILEDYNSNYKQINRNDRCVCGSGKKFKQCHLVYFKQYLNL